MSMYLEYFKYIMEHKINVFKACYIKRRCWRNWKGLLWHGITHDLSKFTPLEFKAYAEHFYGKRNCSKCEFYNKCEPKDCRIAEECSKYKYKHFEEAWVHHYSVNKHHWNHWCYDWEKYYNLPSIDIEDCKLEHPEQIPHDYLIYMICDWEAMGYKFNDTPQQYYLNNYKKIEMDYDSRMMLEFYLGINDSAFNNYGHTIEHFVNMYDEETFNRCFGFIKKHHDVDIYTLLKDEEEL